MSNLKMRKFLQVLGGDNCLPQMYVSRHISLKNKMNVNVVYPSLVKDINNNFIKDIET